MKIMLSAILALFLVGCSEEAPKEVVQKESTPAVVQETKKEVVKDAKVVAIEAVAEVKKEVAKISDAGTKEAEVKTIEVKSAVAEATSSNGEAVYKACASCHGANAEKVALGKSKVIKGWSADKVESALNGYKDGSYGGTMKALMKGQASKLSAEDTKAVSEYISKL